MKIYLANPRGFCAGVVRAIDSVEQVIEKFGAPSYVLHEIVHNKHIINELKDKGAVFVKNINEIPLGQVVIFSAHGVSLEIEKEAKNRGLKAIDATCPLVKSVHKIVELNISKGRDVVIIGHHNHPEVAGTAGRVAEKVYKVANKTDVAKLEIKDPSLLSYVTQTTLSQDDLSEVRTALIERFPNLKSTKSNICFATQNRQDAVRKLAEYSDLILVVGSKNSSNSNRLREVAELCGIESYLIDDYSDIDASWLNGKSNIGITAGASAPERLVEEVVSWLIERGGEEVVELSGKDEDMVFKKCDI